MGCTPVVAPLSNRVTSLLPLRAEIKRQEVGNV